MALDTLAARERHVLLLERYGTLLSQRQREVLDLHLVRDWSLGEIARWRGTSRAAVHDLVQRAEKALEDYDLRLRLLDGERERAAAVDRLRDQVRRLNERLDRLQGAVGPA